MNAKKALKNIVTLFFIMAAIFFALVPLGNIPWLEEGSHTDFIGALLTGISLIGAGISLFVQMAESRKLQEAEFVLNLNQAFVQTEDYAHVYQALEYEYFSSEQYRRENGDEMMNKLEGNVKPEDITRIQISNYLTFFESMYILVQKGAIPMSTLNDLFGYRFFLAAHSELIQREKLVLQPANFRNIYYLEEKWIKYRKANGLNVFREDNCLKNACARANKSDIYNSIMANCPD